MHERLAPRCTTNLVYAMGEVEVASGVRLLPTMLALTQALAYRIEDDKARQTQDE